MIDDDEQIDVVVVGGGLAGLAAAATAASGGARVALLDGHPLGGRARSDQRDGFTFNRGAHALYLGGPAEQVLHELGVAADGAPPPLDGALARRRGRVETLPQGPGTLARSRLLRPAEKIGFARALLRFGKLDPAEWRGRSVAQLRDHLGLRGANAEVLEALVRLSTYVSAPDDLDAGVALASAQSSATGGVRYVHGGWQSLVDGLAASAEARGAELRAGSAARAVADAGERGIAVDLGDRRLMARSVVLAVGTPDAAAGLLGHRPAGWDGIGPPITAASLDLGLRRPPDRRFILGIDEPLYLSMHAPAARLAPEGRSVVHVMRYQAPGDTMPAREQEAVLRGLAADAGISDADIVEQRFAARLVVMGGFPTAAGGGLPGRPSMEVAGHPGVLLAGDWVGPEGMLADAALASGRAAGRAALDRAAKISVG